jgi:NitT/TauT family transport system ATP-binding protein
MIEIKDISKSFIEPDKKEIKVLDNINLSIKKGEFISIIGPNGSGKTTLLNLICGLSLCNEGSIVINDKPVAEAKIGYVFQNYRDSLCPWLRNIDNIAFSLDKSFGNYKKKRLFIEQFLLELKLQNKLPLYKYPYQSSGGQQQAIAILRELIYDPDVLLLDEPFASLDYERKIEQQQMLLNFWTLKEATVILISHDIEDAIFLSDKVVILSNKPASIFEIFNIDLPRPRTLSVLKEDAFFDYKKSVLNSFFKIINK